MACKKCNEQIRKKNHEARKKKIVREYKRDWVRWMFVLFLSVISYGMFALLSRSVQFELPMILRWSIALTWIALFFFTLGVTARMRPGLLSMSALMLWAGPVTQFKTPIVDLVFVFLIFSLVLLLLEVGAGVIFKIKITPVELPWYNGSKLNDVSRGKNES